MPKVIHAKSIYITYTILSLIILNLLFIHDVFAENLDYNITVQPSLNLTTSATDIQLRLNPATNPFASENLTVSVGTNNETGYKLYISAVDNTTNLIEKDDNTLYIETLESEVAETDFTSNRWGYKLNSSSANYSPFTAGNTLVSYSYGAVNDNTNILSFAAKAGYETKPGIYNLALSFKAIANPLFPYIQNLKSSLCTEASLTVVDQRDWREYVVQRLKDGNCWMLQNLRLGQDASIGQNIILTSENTNIDADFNLTGKLNSGQFPVDTGGATYGSNSNNTWDDSAYYCTNDYGCYYNFYATSAGHGTSEISSGNIEYDICPAGWRLPTSGANGEFQRLYSVYNAAAKMLVNPTNLRENANGASAPGFLLGGHYNNSTAPFKMHTCGFYYSSTINNTRQAYSLAVCNDGTVNPSYGDWKYLGYSIRCVLK